MSAVIRLDHMLREATEMSSATWSPDRRARCVMV